MNIYESFLRCSKVLPYYLMSVHLLSAGNKLIYELISGYLVLLILLPDFVAVPLDLIRALLQHSSELLGLILSFELFYPLQLLLKCLCLLLVEFHYGIVLLHGLGEGLHMLGLVFGDVVGLLGDTVTLLVEFVDFHLVENEIPQIFLVF